MLILLLRQFVEHEIIYIEKFVNERRNICEG